MGLNIDRYNVLQSSLKDVLQNKMVKKQKEVKEFRAAHGDTKVGEVTVNMVCNTMCNNKCLYLANRCTEECEVSRAWLQRHQY